MPIPRPGAFWPAKPRSNSARLSVLLNLAILATFGLMGLVLSQWLDGRLKERGEAGLTRVNRQAVDMIDAYASALEQSAQMLGHAFAATLPNGLSLAAPDRSSGDGAFPELRGEGARLNGNNALVDRFTSATGATATIFVKHGDDFVRVATSVRKEDGTRAIGTRLGADHPGYLNLMAGSPYTGEALLFGREYMAHYQPLRSSSGEVVGIAYIGFDFSDSLKALKKKLLAIRIGKTGYIYVMDGRRNPGLVLIHPVIEGSNALASEDAGTRTLAGQLIDRKQGLVNYDWQTATADGKVARQKVAAFETFPKWGWIIAASAFSDEVYRDSRDLRIQLFAFGIVIASGLLLVVYLSIRRFKAAEEELSGSEQRLRSLFSASPVGIALTDGDGNFIDFNESYRKITGYEREELNALSIDRITPRKYRSEYRQQMDLLRQDGHYGPYDREYLNKDGKPIPVQASGALMRGPDGKDYIWSIVEDISERSRAQFELKLAASVFRNIQEGISIVDANRCFLDVNQAFTKITGYGKEEVLGQNPRILQSGYHDGDFYESMWQALRHSGYWRGELWNRRKNGEIYPEQLTISAVRDDQGEITHYVSVFSDITDIKAHEVQLEKMAHFDPLTGLPNRTLLADRMRQAMAQSRRTQTVLAICYLDLDNFKPINDRFGHDVGDRVLTEIAARLVGQVRGGDTVARLGGDEFVLLLLGAESHQECDQAVDRILEAITRPLKVTGQAIAVTASIGVTLYPEDDAAPDILLRHADQAMYLAKENGKNAYHVFDPSQDKLSQTRRQGTRRLEEALANHEFVLFYQPKVNMRTGRVVGSEALIRWQHPERGILPPAEFLHLIEDSDLIVAVGDWVIAEALRQMAVWQEEGLVLGVSVNLAARQLQQPDFVQKLRTSLAAHSSISPALLELEVLETAALEDMVQVSRIMTECHDLGVRFALDDFGTGYSSLTYFRRLPADTLKIDQSFVRNMLNDPEDLAIVEAVIGLTETFRRQAVAEGVETIEHGMMLLQMGCDVAQGYSIARPMPPAAMGEWVRTWRPDAAWVEAAKSRWRREDFPLVLAEIDHRRWVERIVAIAEGESADDAPIMESDRCHFGRWYDREGVARYGGQPDFDAIRPLHDELHFIGRQIVDRRANGRDEGIPALVASLLGHRDKMLLLLRELLKVQSNGGWWANR